MKTIRLNLLIVICLFSFVALTFLSLFFIFHPTVNKLKNMLSENESQNAHTFINEVFVSDIEKQANYLDYNFSIALDFAKHLSKDVDKILTDKDFKSNYNIDLKYNNELDMYFYFDKNNIIKLNESKWGSIIAWHNSKKDSKLSPELQKIVNNVSTLEPVMEAICLNPNGIITIIIKTNNLFVGYSKDVEAMMNLKDTSKEYYLQLYRSSYAKEGIWTNAHPSCFSDDLVISYILPGYNKSLNLKYEVNIGLSYNILESRLDSLLTKGKYNEYDVIRMLINSKGEIMCFPKKYYSAFSINEIGTKDFIQSGKVAFKSKNKNLYELFKEIAAKDNGMCEKTINGEEYLISFRQIPVNDWNVIVLAKTSKLYEKVDNAKRQVDSIFRTKNKNMLFTFIIIFFSALIIPLIFLHKVFITPIEYLRSNFRLLGKGDFSLRIRINSKIREVYELTEDFNKLGKQLQNYTEKLKQEERKREAIKIEMNVAWELQKSVLPKITNAFKKEEFELFAKLIPAKEMSGDFYDFFFISDEILTIVIADVSGKGLPAAFYMSMAKAIIKETCIKAQDINPAKILNSVNENLSRDNERCMFLTAYLVFYNIKTGKLVYSNAGHHEYLTVDGKGDCKVDGISNKAAIGIFEDSNYTNNELTLEKNQIFALYTDGIIEANNAVFDEYGTNKIKEIFKKKYSGTLEKLGNTLINDVIDFQEGKKHDDITLVMIKRTI